MGHLVFSDTRCALGEGALWHPARRSLFWFDILGCKLYERAGARQQVWEFDEHVSAAGWIDRARLLIASETQLFVFDVDAEEEEFIAPLEADTPANRSNDGRADPMGGFWIGTMGKAAERKVGAIYRYHDGTLRKLFDKITISNAICFAPDGRRAYFADTATMAIKTVSLDPDGWPDGAPEVFVDLRGEGLNPDGAVTDAAGNLWNAQWGASRVACYDPTGRFVTAVGLPAGQVTCPAFGGAGLGTLYVTSAAHGAEPGDGFAGATFEIGGLGPGRAEPRVIL